MCKILHIDIHMDERVDSSRGSSPLNFAALGFGGLPITLLGGCHEVSRSCPDIIFLWRDFILRSAKSGSVCESTIGSVSSRSGWSGFHADREWHGIPPDIGGELEWEPEGDDFCELIAIDGGNFEQRYRSGDNGLDYRNQPVAGWRSVEHSVVAGAAVFDVCIAKHDGVWNLGAS